MGIPKYQKRKSKHLRTKNIKRKTGAKSQAKQILALSKCCSKLTKQNFARVRTSWQRDKISLIPTTVGDRIYICPIPYAPCDPLGTGGVDPSWQDNMGGNLTAPYLKRFVFGYPQSAINSNLIYHTGGVLRYQFIATMNTFEQIGVYLIKPKRALADQLLLDRKMKIQGSAAGQRPGSESDLHRDLDFVVHSGTGSLTALQTNFGSEINRKYWDVLYHKQIGFNHPFANGIAVNANANNASPLANAIVRNGTIRLPPGGVIKNASYEPQITQNPAASALEMGYLDQTNENSCYLVVIQNGLPVGAENTIIGGMIVNDYYKCVV